MRKSFAALAAIAALGLGGGLAPSAVEIPTPRVMVRRASGGGGRGKPSQPVPRRGKWSLAELQEMNRAVRVKNPKVAANIDAMHRAWADKKGLTAAA